MIILPESIEFQWDKGNINKNRKRGIENEEIESVFYDKQKLVGPDVKHGGIEKRYIVIGQTKNRRWLFVVITMRVRKIRIISARYMHKKEVKLYEETTKATKV